MNYSEAIKKDPELMADTENPLRFVPGEAKLIACDNCDEPASAELSIQVGWRGCAACISGSASALVEQIEKGDILFFDIIY